MFRLTAAFAPANPVEPALPDTVLAADIAKDPEVPKPAAASDGGAPHSPRRCQTAQAKGPNPTRAPRTNLIGRVTVRQIGGNPQTSSDE